jgi:hypothetical protein
MAENIESDTSLKFKKTLKPWKQVGQTIMPTTNQIRPESPKKLLQLIEHHSATQPLTQTEPHLIGFMLRGHGACFGPIRTEIKMP